MIKINLLPVRQKQKQEAIRRHLVLFVAGLLFVLGVGFATYTAKKSELQGVQDRNSKVEREIEDLKKIIGQVDEYKKQQEILKRKLEVIRRLRANKTGPVHMLDELATHIPEKLWLTNLTEDGGRISLEGVSINNEVIATFMGRLEDSAYFTEVYLVSIQRSEIDGLKLKNFTITARMTLPGVSDEKAG
jgi:type IV pilus assembly protein PilN